MGRLTLGLLAFYINYSVFKDKNKSTGQDGLL